MIRNLWVAALVAISIIGASLGISTDAEAACAGTSAQMKDNASTTFLMGLAADPNGNCSSYFTPIQGGALLGATNGLYSNILQGNAALSATNGLYANLLQGNAVIASGNPLFAQITTGAAVIGAVTQSGAPWSQNLTQIGGSTLTIGQQLAAASIPVILPSATITALTPPSNTGYSTSANQTNASQKTQIVDGSGNVIAATSNNLNVQCANCSGSGASAADAATFTAGTSTFAPAGGEFTSGGATACVTGHQCLVGITAGRAFLTDLTSLAGTALGAGSNYGTSPGAVNVMGVNAFVTNTNANGSATSANSSPVVIASDQAAVAIKAASGAFASGSIASGALASGSISSGAAVSGAFVAGSIADLTHGQGTMAASVPVAIASNQSAVPTTSAVNQTPTNCSGAITTGGTAQNAFTAQTTLHGFTIANIDTGHNDEVLWISFTTTAAPLTAASYPLPAPTATTFAGFGSFTSPTGFGTNVALSVIGATTGHVFSCTWW
jgi:hypothetical protein